MKISENYKHMQSSIHAQTCTWIHKYKHIHATHMLHVHQLNVIVSDGTAGKCMYIFTPQDVCIHLQYNNLICALK